MTKELAVSDEMKEKIQPYFNETTNRYDIEAVRQAMRQEYQSDDDPLGLNFTSALYFGGAMTEDETPEHTMVSAAVQLNEELDYADDKVQNVELIVSDIANYNYSNDDEGDKSITARFNRLTQENQRRLVHNLLELLEAVSEQRNNLEVLVNNRVLYAFTNQLHLGYETGDSDDVPFTHIDLNNAYLFLERGKRSGETYEDLTEEYLASLGL